MSTKFVSIKEIASAMELSPRTIHRREREFGLHHCRDKASKWKRYREQEARQILHDFGCDVTF